MRLRQNNRRNGETILLDPPILKVAGNSHRSRSVDELPAHHRALRWPASVAGAGRPAAVGARCNRWPDMTRKLTMPEISGTLEGGNWPAILTPNEAARLMRIKLSTLYRHVSEGRYGSSVKRGKPLRFWRDRLVQEFMQ